MCYFAKHISLNPRRALIRARDITGCRRIINDVWISKSQMRLSDLTKSEKRGKITEINL